MQMRRPVAVCWRRSDRCNLLASSNYLSDIEQVQNFHAQMTVKREKRVRRRILVSQHDHRPVIEFGLIILEQFDTAVQWRDYGRSGNAKQVYSHVYCPVFRIGRRKVLVVVQLARFRIASKCEASACIGHGLVDQSTKMVDIQTSNRFTTQ